MLYKLWKRLIHTNSLFSLTATLLLSGCGGSDTSQIITTGAAPLAANNTLTVQLPEVEGNTFVNGDPIRVSIKLSDVSASSNLQVKCSDGSVSFDMITGTNGKYTGTYTPTAFGVLSISCTVDDGDTKSSSAILDIEVLPNLDEINAAIQHHCSGELSLEASDNGLAELGVCSIESDNIRIGYTRTLHSDDVQGYNQQPYFLKGTSNPHYLSLVTVSTSGIELSQIGFIRAAEVVNSMQFANITSHNTASYTAIEIAVTEDLVSGQVSYSFEGAFLLDGPIVESIKCGEIALTNANDEHKFVVSTSAFAEHLDQFKGQTRSTSACTQVSRNDSGNMSNSLLRGVLDIQYRSVPGNNPPYFGTIFINPDILTSDDVSIFQSAIFTGTGKRTMFDRRTNSFDSIDDVYLFDANFGNGIVVEVQVNPEFLTLANAEQQAKYYAEAIGRIPSVLLDDLQTVWIHKGNYPFGGGNNNILIHTAQGEIYAGEGILEEVLIHEGSHTSLDRHHANTDKWFAAQQADNTFISEYARDFPDREDIAESFLVFIAVEYLNERLTTQQESTIRVTIPNRLNYFRNQKFDVFPVK